MAEETKKHFYIVYLDQSFPKEIVSEFAGRIPSLGDYVVVSDNLYLVRTDAEATGIYNLFMFDHPEVQGNLLVSQIHPEDGTTAVFGMMLPNTWKFLGMDTAESVAAEAEKAEEQPQPEEEPKPEKKPNKKTTKKK